MDKIYYKKKKTQKIKLKKKITTKKKFLNNKNNSSKTNIQRGGVFDMYIMINLITHAFLNYSNQGKIFTASIYNPTNWAQIIIKKVLPQSFFTGLMFNNSLLNYSSLFLINGILMCSEPIMTTFFNAGTKKIVMMPFDYAYKSMKEEIYRYNPDKIPIEQTWFMKIISMINKLFNKFFKSRYSIIIVGGLSIFLYHLYFNPKENNLLVLSKLFLGVLMLSFFVEIFLDNKLLQFCCSEWKKDNEINQSGGKYSTRKYKGSGDDILSSNFCAQKINDKITIMLLNLKEKINGLSDNEDLLLQKKTRTGIFEKRKVSTFRSFKLGMYKVLTGDQDFDNDLKDVPILDNFLPNSPLNDLGNFITKQIEKDKESIQKEEYKKLKKEALIESVTERVKDNLIQSGGKIESGLIYSIFLTVKCLCSILKYEVSAIKNFIIACLNICLKMISKGFNGLRIFYIFIKKCFIPLVLLTIMLFLHLKFGQKIKQYLKSKILG